MRASIGATMVFLIRLCTMAERRRHSRRRNPYRRGSAPYARLHEAELKRRAALAQALAARTRSPETRRRAKQRASTARRAIREIETREEYRFKLDETDRAIFDHLSITRQNLLLEVDRVYPDSIPKDLPDPFVGPKREALWHLSYSTRAGIRLGARV
jgi:hypothetical protein